LWEQTFVRTANGKKRFRIHKAKKTKKLPNLTYLMRFDFGCHLLMVQFLLLEIFHVTVEIFIWLDAHLYIFSDKEYYAFFQLLHTGNGLLVTAYYFSDLRQLRTELATLY